ncbi:sporulation protein [Actinoplanes sp. TFC3]|uniref:sporulation protein n=1 Tax=Actinoplanes sp. TFC3 TaxID=1710355 RepID=UPI0008358E6D|nr:sporulation protein [Actinoplanes sp. TFC3]
MEFEKVLRGFGLGGPTVHTVLTTADTYPGTPIMGAVRVRGGDYDVAVETIAVGLVTRAEAEDGDALLEFHRAWVAAGFTLAPGEHQDIPFTITPPWETPLTHAHGELLAGMTMGLRTEVTTEEHVDCGDAELVAVHPLPAQDLVLEELETLGFTFHNANVERGAIYGVRLELPFYQELEYTPPRTLHKLMDELELTFVADETGLEVILEYEKHSTLLRPATDSYARFCLDHTATPTDAATALREALPALP